mgnify:CR=1 FL=1
MIARGGIFDAMLNREVFGTSGPRIAPRLFAGWGFDSGLCEDADRDAKGYANGVPMGGDLAQASSAGAKPTFLAYASKDPSGKDLNELQLIKGWLGADGSMHTKVLPLAKASGQGAASLCSVYIDESFETQQSAYYYLRALEAPSPRWHTYDCAQLPKESQPEVCSNGQYPETIREMAWSSPIWYRGAKAES